MSKPFDIATKHLVESRPADWLRYLGINATQADIIDADLSTVVAEADKILRVSAPTLQLVHLEFQSFYERDMGGRLLRYNVLVSLRHGLPVRSVVILLRPEADGPALTGKVE